MFSAILGKDQGQEKKGTTKDKMVGWHHQLNRLESEQTPGYSEGQGSLVCCSPRGCKESDTTEQLTNNTLGMVGLFRFSTSNACVVVFH